MENDLKDVIQKMVESGLTYSAIAKGTGRISKQRLWQLGNYGSKKRLPKTGIYEDLINILREKIDLFENLENELRKRIAAK